MLVIVPSPLEPILPLRDRYRAAMNAQVVHDSWHQRGYTSIFRIRETGVDIGYAAVGAPPGEPHEVMKEFYLVPEARARAERLFAAVLEVARPRWLEAQTNDPFLGPLLERFAPDHQPRAHLFAAGTVSTLSPAGARLRRVEAADHATIFEHTKVPVGEWGLELDATLVATGGLFFHYNPPFGDIYMEVSPAYRRRGLASYLVQELKRICYDGGHVPAARCGVDNVGSRRALERAGMVRCGDIVRGTMVV